MSFLFKKFQEVAQTLAKDRMFAKDARKLQYEADINRLFLFTSYNRVGNKAEEAEIEEIINMASKATISDQENIVQENIHSQIKSFSMCMEDIFQPDTKTINEQINSPQNPNIASRRSGLSFAVGSNNTSSKLHRDVPAIRPLKRLEVSQKLKDLFGYTLDIKPSQILHKESGQGLFLNGEADVGSVLAIYPGVIYSPAYYRYIPGYPRVDAQNPYLITRYDGNVINAQPWGFGDETRELWDVSGVQTIRHNVGSDKKGVDRIWKFLSKPIEGKKVHYGSEVIERRNPLALAHYANHPPKGTTPNVMICPYNFPLSEKEMRVYIPNVAFGGVEEPSMKKFGSFWFNLGTSKNKGSNIPVLKTLVLVSTKALRDEELLLNYRLSNLKRRPEWYAPVDEEEDKRRWS